MIKKMIYVLLVISIILLAITLTIFKKGPEDAKKETFTFVEKYSEKSVANFSFLESSFDSAKESSEFYLVLENKNQRKYFKVKVNNYEYDNLNLEPGDSIILKYYKKGNKEKVKLNGDWFDIRESKTYLEKGES